MKHLLILLILCFFNVQAEWVLVKTDENGGIQAISYKNTDEQTSKLIDQLFNEVINYYQFPMIQMFWHAIPKSIQKDSKEKNAGAGNILKLTKKEIIDALNQNSLVGLINQKLKEFCKKSNSKYQIIDIPRTMFEIAVLSLDGEKSESEIGNSIINFYDSFIKKNTGVSKKLSLNFESSYEKSKKSKDFNLGQFLVDGYHSFNIDNNVKAIYLETCNYLIKNFKDILLKLQKGSYVVSQEEFNSFLNKTILDRKNVEKVNKIVDDYKKTNGSEIQEDAEITEAQLTDFISKKFSNIPLNMLNSVREGVKEELKKNNILGQKKKIDVLPSKEDKIILYKAVKYEQDSNRFVIYRGMKPFKINGKECLDIPYRSLSDNSGTQLSKLHSVSFGTMLGGTFLEAVSFGGARALDYCNRLNFGYALPINVSSFLEKDTSDQIFFIPPFNTVMSLLGCGEAFHPRTKAQITKSINGDGKNRIYGLITFETYFEFPNFLTLNKDPVLISKEVADFISKNARILSDVKEKYKKEVLRNTKEMSQINDNKEDRKKEPLKSNKNKYEVVLQPGVL